MSRPQPPPPGAEAYWASLIAFLYALEPWDFDRDLFGVVLLCLVARSGGLVLDVRRRSEVGPLVGCVRTMLERLFGIRALVLDLRDVHELQRPAGELPGAFVVSGLGEAEHGVKLETLTFLRELEDAGALAIWVRVRGEACAQPWLIDMFTVSYSFDGIVEDAPEGPLSSVPLTREYISTLHSTASAIHIHPPLALHLSNLQTATSLHPKLKTTLTARSQLAFPAVVRAHRVLEGLTAYATAANARAVYLMLVRHRVSLRAVHQEIFWLVHGASKHPVRAQEEAADDAKVRDHGGLLKPKGGRGAGVF